MSYLQHAGLALCHSFICPEQKWSSVYSQSLSALVKPSQSSEVSACSFCKVGIDGAAWEQ